MPNGPCLSREDIHLIVVIAGAVIFHLLLIGAFILKPEHGLALVVTAAALALLLNVWVGFGPAERRA